MKRLLLVAAAAGLAVCAHSVELVTNGSFETGSYSGWSIIPASVGSNYSLFNSSSSQNGQWCAGFSADQGIEDRIYQDLPTTIGQHYFVSFWLWNPSNFDVQTRHGFDAFWEGNTIFHQWPVSHPAGDWFNIRLEVVATQTNSRLELGGFCEESINQIFLDSVSVQPVPEPATLGAVGLGLACLRRRRKARPRG